MVCPWGPRHNSQLHVLPGTQRMHLDKAHLAQFHPLLTSQVNPVFWGWKSYFFLFCKAEKCHYVDGNNDLIPFTLARSRKIIEVRLGNELLNVYGKKAEDGSTHRDSDHNTVLVSGCYAAKTFPNTASTPSKWGSREEKAGSVSNQGYQWQHPGK